MYLGTSTILRNGDSSLQTAWLKLLGKALMRARQPGEQASGRHANVSMDWRAGWTAKLVGANADWRVGILDVSFWSASSN